jgi:hypothetical protein
MRIGRRTGRGEDGLSNLEGLEVDGRDAARGARSRGEGGEVLNFCEDVARCVHVHAGFFVNFDSYGEM